MSEDNTQIQENREEIIEEKTEREYTQSERQAMQYGWKPQDQWEGDPEDWLPARQFIKNGELYGRISRDGHKIQKLEKAIDALLKHNEKVYESGYEAAMDELKQARREAMRENDSEALEQVEERMEALEKRREEGKKLREEVEKDSPPAMHPAWEQWLSRNRWYSENMEMHGAADGIARSLVQNARNAGEQIDYPKLLDEITRRIRQRYPESFGGPVAENRPRQSSGKDDSQDGAGKKKTAMSKRLSEIESNMDEGELEIMNTLITTTGMTKEKYLEDIDKLNRKRR